MSTATTIQAHTAFENTDENLDTSSSGLRKYHFSVKTGDVGVSADSASENAAIRSEAKDGRSLKTMTLDDLGGRSDALGG